MSEEILKALMQLFAIIAKQDEGVESNEREFVVNFLTKQLNDEAVEEYIALFDEHAGYSQKTDGQDDEKKEIKLTSVKDSVKILGICKKINKTLNQEQKIVVLVRLFELVNADRKFSDQRMAIINTVSEVFKVTKEEYNSVRDFVVENESLKVQEHNSILIINDKQETYPEAKHIKAEKLDGNIFILHIASVNLYFLKYTGGEELYLNGLGLNNKSIYLFASGSTVKMPKGKPVYYSDVVSHYLADSSQSKISYQCNHVYYRFATGTLGVQDVSFSEEHGKLIGIMGVSGAGKTTLLNVLSGVTRPSEGEVLINGFDLHKAKDKVEGVIGLIPQDDLLIEELTVFQNLYYNAKLCFKEKTEQELVQMVEKTLTNLGLLDYKNLKVGSPMNKTISGGQRKRLNIALELIREPSILFVDEPTSGLSSRDSENVMDLLRELSLKGKLIFVVIHQPSSEIYKMFDKLMILDVGGHLIYYGNPIEAIMYFKRMDAQINSDVGECPTCGTVNPELIFNIIEARVVDEFGNYTEIRKVSPKKWEENFKTHVILDEVSTINDTPPKSLDIPSWFNQIKIYAIRDLLSKISNTQYVVLNLLEAPVLGFILSYIIRYIADPTSSTYIFRENENIPIFIFMALIVALFLGLTVSAEEIFKDRKILKRESFLNLSRSSYLLSKIIILFMLSAIQALLFVVIANTILGLKGMYFHYWFALFTTAACANMLGLNISASFNSVVTIYIIIPLVMIPMMVLSGAMFEFDKLNRTISSVNKVPMLAEMMPTRWSYEALMVRQFKNNQFEKQFYPVEKEISIADFKQVYLIPELQKKLDEVMSELRQNSKIENTSHNVVLLHNEIVKEMRNNPENEFEDVAKVTPETFDLNLAYDVKDYLDNLNAFYSHIYQKASEKKEKAISYLLERDPVMYQKFNDNYHNESVSDIVKKVFEKNKILEFRNEFIQQVDPIFQNPSINHFADFRAHFYAPVKHFAGVLFDTYWFNMLIIWLFTSIFYAALYYELFIKLMNRFSFTKSTPG